jgi:hypothetical protein
MDKKLLKGQLPTHDSELFRVSEDLAYAFFHALVLLGLVSLAALLFISLACSC